VGSADTSKLIGGASPSVALREVRRVLVWVLLANLAVAAAKILLGKLTGAISVEADGYHSLVDASSSVVGLVGIATAARPPDANHPYGHRRFELFAALVIGMFLMLACYEILSSAYHRLVTGAIPQVSWVSFVVMLGTLAVNLVVSTVERSRGKRLKSEVLMADAFHTSSDILVSLSVIVSLAGVRMGFPWLDPVAAVAIAGVIAYAGFTVVRRSGLALSDAAVLATEQVEDLVLKVQGVTSCHAIRSRGWGSNVYVDLHVQVDPRLSIGEAHEIAHRVKQEIIDRFGAADVVIHVEPAKEVGVGDGSGTG
jgi:cation diffusion facilitator family transporter